MSLPKTNSLTALVILLALNGCSKKQEKQVITTPAATVIPVQTAPAESRRIDESISVSGALFPDESVALSSESAGRLVALYVDFGQTVHKGQIVGQLDASQYRFQLQRAEAALKEAQARLGLNANGKEQSDQTPAMRQAAAQMEDARFKFRNAQKLVQSGDISQEHFQELEKAFRAREAAYEETRNAMLTGIANFDSLQADIRLAQKHLNDCTLRSPFNGSVSSRPVSPGQYIKENTTVLTLVKSSPLRLRASLPQSAAGDVKSGSTLTFTTDAVPGREFHAIVRELDPALDEKSRTLTVEARLENTAVDNRGHTLLRPGMFVQVKLVTKPNTQITVVPQSALYSLAGLSKVFLIQDGRAREVRLGSPNLVGNWVQVPSTEIHPGDTVAVSNLPMLIDGSSVKIGRT